MGYPTIGYILNSVMSKSIYSAEYKKVVEKLRVSREEVGLTQAQVADLLNKPQSYISKIERGERRLDVAELTKIAKIYKKDISYFVE